MKYEKTKGIVLNTVLSKEADKNVVIFSERYGKIVSVAPGAAKPTAKLSFGLEPFCESELMIYNIRSFARSRVTSAVLLDSFPEVRKDFRRALAALSCLEKFEKVTPWFEPDRKKYALLRRTIELLSDCDNPGNIIIGYQLRLIKQCGYDFYRYSRANGLDEELVEISRDISALPGEDLDCFNISDSVEKKVSRTLDVYFNSIIVGNM